ncbi:uncharacterized protein F4822DRAFT_415708 [Hypoxylon trugodes]|uniref:uncharacterized protein n=1 Tax=Hypoxylon trugodes TaxID=326681 RepID=UPI00218F9B2C|nr:uncharacterized protein F4822DRAFT_415708 [Hypoxylon trugodes]KAI1384610.1 hypothetical protein F4822DRAFT_415708 [Hypoxylon trugodes]
MTSEAASPKRRHILSSLNQDRRSASPKMDEEIRTSPEAPPTEPHPDIEQDEAEEATTETRERKRTSRFRFKSEKSSRSRRHRSHDRDRDHNDADHEDGTSHRRHRHHHRHHRHKRRRTHSPSPLKEPQRDPFEPPPLGSEAAFRESLFDAMADDEGAAYWESVYGQPVHIYSPTRPAADGSGALEQMSEDEYAAYVRQKMWEKTHQGLLEERARREERKKEKEEQEEEKRRLTREMERSLRRGEERRRKRGWRERWVEYGEKWNVWDGTLEGIAWPVKSGLREDVGADAVRDFFVLGIDPTEVGEAEFLAKLKEERVRWHPDKIQQKLGGKVDDAIMRDVTAVFQIVDKLWSDTRAKKL